MLWHCLVTVVISGKNKVVMLDVIHFKYTLLEIEQRNTVEEYCGTTKQDAYPNLRSCKNFFYPDFVQTGNLKHCKRLQ